MVPDRCQNLNSKGGKSEQNILGVVGGIVRREEVAGGIAAQSVCDQLGVLSAINLGF